LLAGLAEQQADSGKTHFARRRPTRFASLDQLGADAVDKPALGRSKVRADDVDVVETDDV
jgi:hypothetical protein